MTEHSHIQELSNRVREAGARADGAARSGRPAAEGTAQAQRIGGRYRLAARIGRGRLGEIYEAVDEASSDLGVERHVAIQLIEPQIVAKKGVLDDLRRAYAALRAAPHANVVDILDFGSDSDAPYVVMELVEGASLRFVLDDATALSTDEALAVIRAVGDAFQYLHAKGLVYGVLKPENVMITFDYAIKLLDIAPASPPSAVSYYVEETDSRAGARDARDDVLSLACLTYELLAGKHPFNSNSPLEAQRAGLKPLPINGLAPGQWRAIAAGLALQRGLRTSTVAEFLDELGVRRIERLRAPDDTPVPDPELHPELDLPLPPPSPPRTPRAADYTFLNPPAPPAQRVPERDYSPRAASAVVVEDYSRQRPVRVQPESSLTFATTRTILAAVVVGGLGALAYVYYEPMQERAAELFAARDVSREPAAAESTAPTTAPNAAPAVPGDEDPFAPAEGESAGSTAPARGEAPAASIASTAETVPTQSGQPAAPPIDLPATTPEPLPFASDAPAPLPLPSDTPAPGEAPAERAAPSPPSGPPFAFATAIVRVEESAAAAVVVVHRSGDLSRPASFAWWTSNDSAVADEDYADLGQRTEYFAAGEETHSLYIPLIVDAVPERTESFYVYLGNYDPRQGSLEPLSGTRVDIADDD